MRKNKPARYSLPDDPTPANYRGFCVTVPDDPKHIAAFLGQIKALSSAYAWADDDSHTALLAASAWKPTFQTVSVDKPGCGVSVPQNLCISGTFANDGYGFTGDSAPCPPVLVPGVGWQSCLDGSGTNLQTLDITRVFGNATYVTHANLKIHRDIPNSYHVYIDFFYLGSVVYHNDFQVMAGGDGFFNQDINQNCDAWTISVIGDGTGNINLITLTEWGMCYIGAFPLTESPTQVCRFFDWTTSDEGFTVWTERPYGTWAVGGWQPQPNFVGNDSIYIGRPIVANGIITSFSINGQTGATGGQMDINNEFINHYSPTGLPVGSFNVSQSGINWVVSPGQRFLMVLLHVSGTDAGLRLIDCQVCSSNPIFS